MHLFKSGLVFGKPCSHSFSGQYFRHGFFDDAADVRLKGQIKQIFFFFYVLLIRLSCLK